MDYQEILNNIIYTLVTTLLPLLITYVVLIAKNKLKEMTNKIENEETREALQRLNSLIGDAIIDTTNNFTIKLKEDGKWTNETAQEALEKSLETVKAQLTEDMKVMITEKYNDLEAYLKAQIIAMYEKDKEVNTIGNLVTKVNYV